MYCISILMFSGNAGQQGGRYELTLNSLCQRALTIAYVFLSSFAFVSKFLLRLSYSKFCLYMPAILSPRYSSDEYTWAF